MEYTVHAEARMQQRGFTASDLELIQRVGEPIGDGFVLTKKSINARTRELKRELQRLEHLRNACVIERDGRLITVFNVNPRNLRQRRIKAEGCV